MDGIEKRGAMNYYEICDRYSGELLTRGNVAECRKVLDAPALTASTLWQIGRGGGSTKNIGSSSKKAGR